MLCISVRQLPPTSKNSSKMGTCQTTPKNLEAKTEFEVNNKKPDPQNFLKNVIKIQSFVRGALSRKKYFKEQLKNYNDQIIDRLQDYGHNYNFNRGKRLPVFNYSYEKDHEDPEFETRKFLPAVQTEGGGVYRGEWYFIFIKIEFNVIYQRVGNKRHGRGVQVWPDGSIYEGYWRNNQANILGRLIHADGDIYEGEWVNDKANGYGTYIHMDGTKYVGYWKDDQQHGKGFETWTDGSKYEGEYVNGCKEGKGKYSLADGSVYEGQFRNNNFEGIGMNILSYCILVCA